MVSASANIADPHRPLVQLERVGVDFARQRVLRDIDLAIPRGQTLAIIGESGCGKTVLLKTIIGLLRPSRGTVYFDGKNLAQLREKEMTRQRTRFGFLFQQAALFDSMTIAQNVAFPLRQHTAKRPEEIRRIVLARLAEVGLPENVVMKKPAELSGGMRKRVGIARAIAGKPKYLLYDEPTSGLDPVNADIIDALVQRLDQELGVTSIMVTHDVRGAFRVANRLALLSEGKVVMQGTPQEFLASENPKVKAFLERDFDNSQFAA